MRIPKMGACVAGVLAAMPICAWAAPVVLTPSATIEIPDERFDVIQDVAIDGDWIIMAASKYDEPFPGDRQFVQAAFLFRRAADGTWTHVRTLLDDGGVLDDREIQIRVAMNNGLAAIATPGGIDVYELRNGDWAYQRVPQSRVGGYTLEIDAGTILASDGACGAGVVAYRKNSQGTFAAVYRYQALPYYCSDGEQLEQGDISGSIVVLPQADNESGQGG